MTTLVTLICDFCRQPIDGPVVRVRLDRVAVRREWDVHDGCLVSVAGQVVGAVESEKGKAVGK